MSADFILSLPLLTFDHRFTLVSPTFIFLSPTFIIPSASRSFFNIPLCIIPIKSLCIRAVHEKLYFC